MANRLLAAIGSLTEVVARFWPLSKSPEQIIAEYDARHGPPPHDEQAPEPAPPAGEHPGSPPG